MANIDELKAAMSALPAKEAAADKSLKQQIAKLRQQIKELHFNKCWSWSDIASWLSENNIKISESTLKLYYYKSSPKKAKEREVKAGQGQAHSSSPAHDTKFQTATNDPQQNPSTINPILD